MKKLIILLLFLLLFANPAASSSLVNRIVAIVDGETITLLELQSRVQFLLSLYEDMDIDDLPEVQLKETQRQVLDQMINDILLKQEAERYGIEVTDRELRGHVESVRAENNMTEEEFEAFLAEQDMTPETYKKQIRDTIIRRQVLSMMVHRKVLVTQDEIEQFYKERISQYQSDREVHLKVILVPDIEKAIHIKQDIEKGAISFDQAAAEYSQGPNPSQGGDLGLVNWNRIAPEWQQALAGLEQGNISSPFKVRGAGAIIKLVESRTDKVMPLSEVEDRIRERLYESKLEERFEEYIQRLRERSVIDVRL